jgi:xanthine dehydrogenase molybdopterin binding subunit
MMKTSSAKNQQEQVHESAVKHVTGEAVYINDMTFGSDLLYGYIVQSPYAHAEILSIDFTAALKEPGVVAILDYHDIPGENQMGPVFHDEPCLAERKVHFIGQAVLIIAAVDEESARAAEKLIRIEYSPLDPVLTIEDSMACNNRLAPQRKIERGDPDAAFASCAHVFEGELRTGAQEHWYLETQSCVCVPGEDGDMMVYSSTQNPSETQAIVAEVLGLPKHCVVCETRRMGGGFGGKETQGNHVAAWAALLARRTGRAVRFHLSREIDQKITGKRHRFLSKYKAGFDKEGHIVAYTVDLNCDAGATADLSMAILERAMLHAENAYYIPNIRILGNAWKTNLPSNVAFRGFGGPQGIAVIETVMDRIARIMRIDAEEIRNRNYYGIDKNNITPYGEEVSNNRIAILREQLLKSSDYKQRCSEIEQFNSSHRHTKRGIAMTPVKFGISFTTSFLNQAGALVHIYNDGSVLVNHGGTEMGQGLYTKILQIAAAELGVSSDRIKVNATNTSKVPNASATAASSGSDLNGMAVKNAMETLKERLKPQAVKMLAAMNIAADKEDILFEGDHVFGKKNPAEKIPFVALASAAYLAQISLSATGYYSTPDIWFDREKGTGRPFHYFAFGMAVSEVEIDCLTGGMQLLRSDILHDVGESLNPAIDLGQVEGGFIQGTGWCTSEEIRWNEAGLIMNASPDTYKIPGVRDIPKIFNVALLKDAPQPNTIRRSKAVGEPPLMLAFSVWLAIKDAISACGNHEVEPQYSLPATHETILMSIAELKRRKK